MGFQEKFKEHRVKVWEEFYLDFSLIVTLLAPLKMMYNKKITSVYKKEKLYHNFSKSTPELSEMLTYGEEDVKEESEKLHRSFLEQFKLELRKVEYFYFELLNKRIKPRFSAIRSQIDHANRINEFKIYEDNFEMALKELYKELELLRGFTTTNLEAKNKLMHKYKKYCQYAFKDKYNENEKKIEDEFNALNLSKSKEQIDKISNEIFEIFNVCYFDKYKGVASKIIKSYGQGNKFTQSQSFYLGFFVGLMLFQICIIFLIAFQYNIDIDTDIDFKSVFPMFKAFLVVCLYWWMLGFNVWVWNKNQISYKIIFRFDNHYSEVISIYKRAAAFTFILLACMILYLIDRANLNSFIHIKIPIHYLPLICWGSFLIYMFCPFKIFNYQGRIYLFKLFAESFMSFFLKPDFSHVYLITQLTSIIGPMRDMEYTLCYYAYYSAPLSVKKSHCSNSRGIFLFIAFFPHIIRILQCIKMLIDKSGNPTHHRQNIVKFMISLLIATFSFLLQTYPAFYYLWFITSIFSTVIGYLWEIVRDWGLFDRNSKDFPLREKRCYPKGFYYFVIVANFFLKFLWLITISPEVINSFIRPEALSVTLFTLEIFRRGMWNIIKVEMKYFEISKEFRVSNDVELPFIKEKGKFVNNETNLLRVMKMTREEKIRVEMEKILQEKTNKIVYETRVIQDFDVKLKAKTNDEFNEFLKGYKKSTHENLLDDSTNFKRELSRKV